MALNRPGEISHDTCVTRPPPEIRRLLPPQRKPVAWGYLGVFLVVVTVTSIQFGRAAPAFKIAWGLVFAGIGVLAALCTALQRRRCRTFNRGRADYSRRHPDAIDNVDLWKDLKAACMVMPFMRPGAVSIDTLRQTNLESNAAVVLCAGLIEVPDVSHAAFEPEIMTPSRHQLGSIILALILLAGYAWLGGQLWTGQIRLRADTCLIMGIGAAFMTITAIHSLVLRSTYVRLAPGMIQFVSFGILIRKPQIRSYPRQAGTVVVIGDFGWLDRRFLVTCGKNADGIYLSGMLRAKHGLDWLWRALLCPAPTPRLSDEDLLG